MSLLESLEKEIKRIAKEAIDEKVAGWRLPENSEQKKKSLQFELRVGHPWTDAERKALYKKVAIFLDTIALEHGRERGGIASQLNKMMKAGELCGLRDESHHSSLHSRTVISSRSRK